MALKVGDLIDPIAENPGPKNPGLCKSPPTMDKKTYGNEEFLILPYAPGGINHTETLGLAVLSGPFSGCWMARFTIPGEGTHVCHVATPECNDEWNKLKKTYTDVTQFKPAKALEQLIGKVDLTGVLSKTYGIVTSTGQFSSLVVRQDGKKLRVVRIVPRQHHES